MTEQSLCKSFFKSYLFYKIKQNSTFLLLCCIINIMALPLFAVSMNSGLQSVNTDFHGISKFYSIIMIIALLIPAALGAVSSYDFYTKKNLSDTIGSLPLSYKERFWADFLSGYIVNVAPIIPFGVISVCILGASQEKFKAFTEAHEIKYIPSLAGIGAALFFTVFIILTFTYILTVVVVSSCGKVLPAALVSVIAALGLPMAAGGIAGSFACSVTGMNVDSVAESAAALLPPIGLFGEAGGIIGLLIDLITVGSSERGMDFIAAKPLYIIVYVVLAAALVAAAYFMGKRRKTESTGSRISFKPLYYIICVLSTVGVTLSLIDFAYHKTSAYLLIGLIGGAVMCIVNILIYLPKKKNILRCAACGAGGLALSFAVFFLFDKTAAFGLRYIPEDGSKYEYLITNNMKITDKDEISQYAKLLNADVKNLNSFLGYGLNSIIKLEYKTSDGKIKKRSYARTNYSIDDSDFYYFSYNVSELDSYGKFFFEEPEEFKGLSVSVILSDITIDIPEDKTEEFISTIKREAAEKYKKNAEAYGQAAFKSGEYSMRTFYIQKDFTDTISLIENIEYLKETDPESTYISISYNNNLASYDSRRSIAVSVPYKNRNNENVKRLMELLNNDPDFKDYNGSFKVSFKGLSKTAYHVPNENAQKVVDILTELAIEDIKSYDPATDPNNTNLS